VIKLTIIIIIIIINVRIYRQTDRQTFQQQQNTCAVTRIIMCAAGDIPKTFSTHDNKHLGQTTVRHTKALHKQPHWLPGIYFEYY